MDGSQSLVREVRDTDEAKRQSEVYAAAMKSIEAERRRSEATGYAVMATLHAEEDPGKSRLMQFVHMFLIGFAMIMPLVALWAIALD